MARKSSGALIAVGSTIAVIGSSFVCGVVLLDNKHWWHWLLIAVGVLSLAFGLWIVLVGFKRDAVVAVPNAGSPIQSQSGGRNSINYLAGRDINIGPAE